MNIRQTSVAATLSYLLISPLAMAEHPHARQSFTTHATRTHSAGHSLTRQTEQTATANGFRRDTTLSTDSGKTAQRSVLGSYDADSKTATRSVSGTRMNGDTYSSTRITQKTESGFNRSETQTNAAGNTATRQTEVVVDKEHQTVTKNISATGFDGETHSATVVKTFNKVETTDSEG